MGSINVNILETVTGTIFEPEAEEVANIWWGTSAKLNDECRGKVG
jgi:hypothetical protein